MAEFRMPALGADMESGILTQWLVGPGATVRSGDVIATVETHKGIIDVEIFHDAVIERLLVEPGSRVPVGAPLAVLANGTRPAAGPATPGAPPAAPTTLPPGAAEPPPAAAAATVTAVPGAEGRARVSPLARRHAAELGIPLERLSGTGPGGAVTVADVERQAGEVISAADPATQMRAVIAAAMARSKREIPHYYLASRIPMEAALEWLAARNAAVGLERRIVPTLLFVRATALALARFPEFSGSWSSGGFTPAPEPQVGVAIALRGGGLVAPALKDAASRSLDELAPAFLDLVNRVRSGRVRSSEASSATITVTSLGDQGVETVFPVIYPPQVAIVGFGSIMTETCLLDDGSAGQRRLVQASLAADHRVSDGHRGALFLQSISRLLQEPERL